MYQPTRAYAKYVLYILLLVYVSNQWSRYLLNYMYSISYDGMTEAEAEKYSITYATDITASEYGLLVGFGFSFMYVLCGLVMGRAADSSSRRNIIFAGLVIWNVAIVIMGMSNNFVQLLISRIILGIGESFSAPASYSLIADYFPVEARAEANGIYAFGVYVGGGLGSLAIAMSDGVGWRTACYIVAVYGFILAALTILTVKEPERTQKKSVEAAPQEAEYTFLESLREIFSSKLVCILFIAGSVRFMGGYAIASFLPTFYSYQFTSYSTLYSYLNASVVAFGGALSSYLGGKFADGWEKAGNRVRGTGIACFTFITTMVGSGTSYGMGIIYDNIVDDDEEDPTNTIKTELLVAVVASYGIAAYLFYIAASFMEDENEISAEKAGLLSKQSAAASSAVEEEEASNKAEAV
mmetsp:Transcript_23972/g.31122  ORF Transcript_23972/g.31122 Transcript_23972/m.31122 type:complete len:410 (+) Transcript_23972:92-1321(+)